MPCELLIHAKAHSKAIKGSIETVKDSPAIWGGKEGLPDYVILTITDKTKEQVRAYRERLQELFYSELLNSDAEGRRYRIWVNPNIGIINTAKGMRAKFRDFLVNKYGAQVVTYSPPNEAVFDIPNTDWTKLQSEIHDRFTKAINGQRYYFLEDDVDAAVGNGGKASLTGNQAAARIVDRLA